MFQTQTTSGARLPILPSPREAGTAGRMAQAIRRIAAENDGNVTVHQIAEAGFTPEEINACGLHGVAFAARRQAAA